MKKVLIAVLIAAFAGFAWLSLPELEQAKPGEAAWQLADGSGLLIALDTGKGEVTISHGAMPALGMPPMTMGYAVQDRRQLAGLKPMQKVEFRVAYNGTDYLITDIR